MLLSVDRLTGGGPNGAVRSVQEMLNYLGFRYRDPGGTVMALDEDGLFGAKTEDVVIDFQRSEGLLADGVVGPSTMRALEKAYSERVMELTSPGADSVGGVPTDGRGVPVRLSLERVPADRAKPNDKSYKRLSLRSDAA